MDPNTIYVYTDGASKPHSTKEGGWGMVAIFRGKEVRRKGYIPAPTTNNVAELMGPIEALRLFTGNTKSRIVVISDSQYVVKGVMEWRHNWKRSGWPTKNTELWRELSDLVDNYKDVSFKWVRGHSGDHYNEIADQLSREAIADGLTQ